MHKHLTMKNLMSGYGMRLAHPNGMARACHIPNSTRGNLRENTARLESKRSLLRFGIDSWNQTYQRLNLFVEQSSVEAASERLRTAAVGLDFPSVFYGSFDLFPETPSTCIKSQISASGCMAQASPIVSRQIRASSSLPKL